VALFEVGVIRITPSAALMLEGSPDSTHWEGFELLKRHTSGDWGEVSEGNARENDLSVREGFRVFSVYTRRSGHKVWVITHADRESTIILSAEEY
jgi:hypothetical protein